MSFTKNFDKVYIKLDGNEYYGYNGILVVENEWYLRHLKTPGLILTNSEVTELFSEGKIDNFLDDKFVLNAGDAIHVVPDCKYAIADLRNNYKIKRDFDTGVCNVYTSLDKPSYSIWIGKTVVVPEIKTLILFSDCLNDVTALSEAKEIIPEISNMVHGVYSESYRLIATKKLSGYIPLLMSTAKKPCISYKKLEFNTNELTVDVLTMIKKSGERALYDDKNAVDNFLIQIGMLNQHNWREYPNALKVMLNTIDEFRTAKGEVFGCPSKYPKYVKEMYEVTRHHYAYTEKDFNMVKAYYEQLLDLRDDTMFVDTVSLSQKANAVGLNLAQLNTVFNLTTRITPRKYEQN